MCPCIAPVFSKNSVRFWGSCLAFFSSAPSEMLAWGKTIGCPGHKNSQMLAAVYWCVQNSSSRFPQTSASLKVQSDAECSKLAVQCTLDDPWTFYCFMCSCCLEPTFLRWEWEELQANFAYVLQFFTMRAVCFIVFLKSFLSCQALAEALQQNSTLTYLDLEWNNIGPEGVKAWCLVKMVSWGEKVWRNCRGRVKAQLFESEVREMTKGNAVQYWCSDVPNTSLRSVMTTDWGYRKSSKLNTCKRRNRFKKAIVSSGSMIVVSTRELGPWGTGQYLSLVIGQCQYDLLFRFDHRWARHFLFSLGLGAWKLNLEMGRSRGRL